MKPDRRSGDQGLVEVEAVVVVAAVVEGVVEAEAAVGETAGSLTF
jgi:hypothetical protein